MSCPRAREAIITHVTFLHVRAHLAFALKMIDNQAVPSSLLNTVVFVKKKEGTAIKIPSKYYYY